MLKSCLIYPSFCCFCCCPGIIPSCRSLYLSLTLIALSPDHLYFLVTEEGYRPPASSKYLYLNTDSTLVYTAFFADFGPLDLGLECMFCEQLSQLLKTASASNKAVIYHCSSHPHRRANSAVLICAYLVREDMRCPFLFVCVPLMACSAGPTFDLCLCVFLTLLRFSISVIRTMRFVYLSHRYLYSTTPWRTRTGHSLVSG
jgi:Dual specificity protein phosphatase, N-terminal half